MKNTNKLHTDDEDNLEDIEESLNNYLSNDENKEEFSKYLDEWSKLPFNTHLLCNEISCKYNRPNNPEIGTICWCSKYSNNQEDICNKECNKRWWYELSI